MRQTCEHLRLADDIRVAMKPVLPHLIADNGHWMRIATDVLADFEAAAEYGMDTDCVKIVRRYHAAGDALRAIADGQRRSGDFFGDERVSERAAAFEILEVWPRDVVSVRAAVCAGERDQSVLVDDKRIWTKEDALDPTKHRRGRADPDRQTHHREDRETWIPPQHPKSETEILKHGCSQVVLKTLTNARSENATIVMVEAHSMRRIALAASARIGPKVMPNDWCNRYSATVNAASVSNALDVHAVAVLANPTPIVAKMLAVTNAPTLFAFTDNAHADTIA